MVLGIKKNPDGTKIQNVLVKQIIVVLKFAFVLHVFNRGFFSLVNVQHTVLLEMD